MAAGAAAERQDDQAEEWAVTTGKVPTGAKRPQPKGGSRKGRPNKVTRELRDMILGALDAAGGEAYLVERATDARTASAFVALLGKCLPKDVKLEATVTLTDLLKQAAARRGQP